MGRHGEGEHETSVESHSQSKFAVLRKRNSIQHRVMKQNALNILKLTVRNHAAEQVPTKATTPIFNNNAVSYVGNEQVNRNTKQQKR